MFKGDYINGSFVVPSKPDLSWSIHSPADLADEVISVKAETAHVDKAVSSARQAFKDWARLTSDARKEYLLKLKTIFEKRADEMAELISREMGKPLWEAKTEAAALSGKIALTLGHSSQLAEEIKYEDVNPGVAGVIRSKPRGVMAVVGPFNFPAHLANGHIIPALFVGNTAVFKPSDKTPGVGQLMAECYEEAGFPPGVFNLVQGQAAVGQALSVHKDVDGVLFTGSYEVGLAIKKATIDQYWKILALEMGGKNTTLVWDDADIEKAVYDTIIGSFLTTGQRCSCTSRLVLHEKVRDKFLDNFVETAKKLKIGHWSENPFMGPLVTEASMNNCLKFQDVARSEGADVLLEAEQLSFEKKGYYVSPSINMVDKLNLESEYQQNEIFGPNVAVYTVDDYSDALEIVNSGGYGLVMALFSSNEEIYKKALLDAKVGLLNWNRTTNGASGKLPFGGMGKSGNDRPSGHFAINYCVVPVASLEDPTKFNGDKMMPGIEYNYR